MNLYPSTNTKEDYPLILTTFHVQEIMNLSRPKVFEMVHTEGFPKIRCGRVFRIPRDSFFKWLEQQVDMAG